MGTIHKVRTHHFSDFLTLSPSVRSHTQIHRPSCTRVQFFFQGVGISPFSPTPLTPLERKDGHKDGRTFHIIGPFSLVPRGTNIKEAPTHTYIHPRISFYKQLRILVSTRVAYILMKNELLLLTGDA